MRLSICVLVLVLASVPTLATTWNEPWQDEVVRLADIFVKVQITERSDRRAIAKVLSLLAGSEAERSISIQGYSVLQIGSISSGGLHELELPFKIGSEYYLLVKKDPKTGSYQLPTPTSGWAWVEKGDVYATYRHSYHKALVPIDVYEKTMLGIFNAAKNKPVDEGVAAFIKAQLGMAPADLSNDFAAPETKRFFLQHVALETFFHTGIGADLSALKPFLAFSGAQVQISAARAVGRIKSAEAQDLLMAFIDGTGVGFAKVMCVWALKHQNARHLEARLRAFNKKGKDQETGFGGSIMDPRVGTFFPSSVKSSIEMLLAEWNAAGNKG